MLSVLVDPVLIELNVRDDFGLSIALMNRDPKLAESVFLGSTGMETGRSVHHFAKNSARFSLIKTLGRDPLGRTAEIKASNMN
jgi:hypothetical protein